jgi:HSP20 family protein
VSGKREPEAPPRDQDRFFVYERGYGSFSRAFTLPAGIDPDRLGAELKDGVLKLILPKRPEMQPRRIAIGQKPPGERGQA